MRENRGGGRSSKNSGDPTLKDHEKAKGTPEAAIHGEKKVDASPSRTSARKHQSDSSG